MWSSRPVEGREALEPCALPSPPFPARALTAQRHHSGVLSAVRAALSAELFLAARSAYGTAPTDLARQVSLLA